MSDTPRTDAATHTEEGKEWLQEDAYRLHELGKQLERELAAANALNAELLEALKNLVGATAHLKPCEGSMEMARAAIAKAEGK